LYVYTTERKENSEKMQDPGTLAMNYIRWEPNLDLKTMQAAFRDPSSLSDCTQNQMQELNPLIDLLFGALLQGAEQAW
jgi:hypothetical protein